MLASDYPHEDPMAEANLLSELTKREDIPDEVKNKILMENPTRFYSL